MPRAARRSNSKRDRGSNKVDHQEGQEEHHQLLKAGRIGGFRMEILLHVIPGHADDEHHVNKRRDQRKQDLKNQDVGQRDPAQRPLAGKDPAVLLDRLQDAERPAEALAHQAVRSRRRLGIGERLIFVLDPVAPRSSAMVRSASSATVST